MALTLEPAPRFIPHTRALAILHVAMHDAINSISDSRRYATYSPRASAADGASPEAAAHAAARWILREYVRTNDPANTQRLEEIEALYTSSLASLSDSTEKTRGIEVGEAVAAALWEARANDGWNNPSQKPYVAAAPAPMVWRQVPPWQPTMPPSFYWWGDLKPWVLERNSQFMAPPPPQPNDARFLEDVAEVRAYGAAQSTLRTEAQAASAQWWGNCTDNVMVLAQQLIIDHEEGLYDSARIFALLALVQSDALISNIHNKAHWNFWRPITVIHESGQNDWTPYLRTPPSEEYPAGHPMGSGGGAYLLEKFYPGTLKKPVEVVSPVCGPRTYASLSEVVDDVIGARVWGGMHFRGSGEVGAALGKDVANWIYERTLLPPQEE
ncbi:MAG TPA: hypothetical protein VF815_47135 [Myxococcaceae bacterium]|jgi:hypothetical protein